MPALPSPTHPLVGRDEALATLASRAINAAEPSVTVIGGDAGVGKTRLITEVMLRADAAGGRVLAGHCLDLGESSAPYLPISEMLRRLTLDDPDSADALRTGRPLLAPLLRSAQRVAPADERLADLDPAAFFEAFHAYLEHLAQDGHLLVVVEDTHWADRSTRDLLTYLFTIDFRGPVSIVASYRGDDLFRKHPLRRKLAEWSRLPHVQRMTLEPLTSSQMGALLHTRSPQLAGPRAERIIRRAAGNPFFAEELLAVSELGQGGLPEELADLLLLRVDSLDDEVRSVVRAASAAGQFISHDLLRHVAGLDDVSLDRALRVIVEHHIFSITPRGDYAFRHALLSEAVADDLLPGERVRLHERYAQAWQRRVDPGAAAALAFHARAAGMTGLALRASIDAGDEAMAASGPADAAQHYQNALGLLAKIPDQQWPICPADLALRTGSALMAAGDPHRAVDVLAAARRETSNDRVQRAKLAAHLVEAELVADQPGISISVLDESIDDLEKHPADKTLALLYAVRARALLSERHLDESALAATEALRLARELALPHLVTNATTTLARLDDYAGDPDASRARLQDVVEQARAAGDVAAEVRAMHQLAVVLVRAELPAEAAHTLADAVDRAVEQNFSTGPFALEARVLSAYYSILVGEWDLADRLLRPDAMRVPEIAGAMMRVTRATLAHRRGHDQEGIVQARSLEPLWNRDMFIAIHSASLWMLVCGERGDLAEMLSVYDRLVSALQSSFRLNAFDAQVRLATQLTGFLADAVIARQAKPADYADRVRALAADAERVVGMRSSSRSLGLESQAWLCLLRAEQARFTWHGVGRPPAEALAATQDAAAIFDTLGYRYDAAWTRERLARLLAAIGDQGRARAAAADALEQARSLGATTLVTTLRAHTPAGSRRSRGAVGALTPRERDVLGLLVAGRTNGQIASDLFIATKTASVHVSNILAKLGASTRTEAAAMAAKDPSLTD